MECDWEFQHCLAVKISFYIMTETIAVIAVEPAGDAAFIEGHMETRLM